MGNKASRTDERTARQPHSYSRLIPNLFLRPHLLSTRKSVERKRQAKTARPTATETWGRGWSEPSFAYSLRVPPSKQLPVLRGSQSGAPAPACEGG